MASVRSLLADAVRHQVDLVELSHAAQQLANEHRSATFEWTLPVELTLLIFVKLVVDCMSRPRDTSDSDDDTAGTRDGVWWEINDPEPVVHTLAQVCRAWRALATDRAVWRYMFMNRISSTMQTRIREYLHPPNEPVRPDTLCYLALYRRHEEVLRECGYTVSNRCMVCGGYSWQTCPRTACGGGRPHPNIHTGCPWQTEGRGRGHAHCLTVRLICSALHLYRYAGSEPWTYKPRSFADMIQDDARDELCCLKTFNAKCIDREIYDAPSADDYDPERRRCYVKIDPINAAVASCAHHVKRRVYRQTDTGREYLAEYFVTIRQTEEGWPTYKGERGVAWGCCTRYTGDRIFASDIWDQCAKDADYPTVFEFPDESGLPDVDSMENY